MKPKLILHIPHSSVNIPDRQSYISDKNTIQDEILKLTDWYTYDLFSSEHDDIITAVFLGFPVTLNAL